MKKDLIGGDKRQALAINCTCTFEESGVIGVLNNEQIYKKYLANFFVYFRNLM